jgi:hypothetical protein
MAAAMAMENLVESLILDASGSNICSRSRRILPGLRPASNANPASLP